MAWVAGLGDAAVDVPRHRVAPRRAVHGDDDRVLPSGAEVIIVDDLITHLYGAMSGTYDRA